VVETDAPFLTPVPHRGTPNGPAFVPLVGAAVAAAQGAPVEEVEAATWANTAALFDLPIRP
jgi:TatD DNase family protein